jgi:hypothetical protein
MGLCLRNNSNIKEGNVEGFKIIKLTESMINELKKRIGDDINKARKKSLTIRKDWSLYSYYRFY